MTDYKKYSTCLREGLQEEDEIIRMSLGRRRYSTVINKIDGGTYTELPETVKKRLETGETDRGLNENSRAMTHSCATTSSWKLVSKGD